MKETILEDIETYIYMWKNTVTQYIATFPILDLCQDMERRMGSRTLVRRWNQEGLVFPEISAELE